MVVKTLDGIKYNGGVQEAALEAVQKVLPKEDGLKLVKSCVSDDDCAIKWRKKTNRIIILLSDKDSDLPRE